MKDDIRSFLKQILLEVRPSGGLPPPVPINVLEYFALPPLTCKHRARRQRGEEDYSHVERAYEAALQDLRRHYAPDTAGDTFPVIAAGNP